MQRLAVVGTRIALPRWKPWAMLKTWKRFIRNSDGVIAAGRSALESMAQSRAVIFFGEGGVWVLRKPEIWPVALRTNFGDHIEKKDFNAAKLESGLREMLTPRANAQDLNTWARAQIEKEFDIQKVAHHVGNRLRHGPLILMYLPYFTYHRFWFKRPRNASIRKRISVSQNQFRTHLLWLKRFGIARFLYQSMRSSSAKGDAFFTQLRDYL